MFPNPMKSLTKTDATLQERNQLTFRITPIRRLRTRSRPRCLGIGKRCQARSALGASRHAGSAPRIALGRRVRPIAKDTGFDKERLKRDVRTFTDFSSIKSDSADAEDIGIKEDPVIFVNGKRLVWPASASFLLYMLREKMKADGMS